MYLPNYAWENPPEVDWDEIEQCEAGVTEHIDRTLPEAIATIRQALYDDAVAATMVAATINTRQAAGESGPAFVKRIVRSWLEEMGR